MAGEGKNKSGFPGADQVSMEDLLASIQQIILAGNDNTFRSIGPSQAPTADEIDNVLLAAMDVISASIEDHNERWNAVLDTVESDLEAMLPAGRTLAPNAA